MEDKPEVKRNEKTAPDDKSKQIEKLELLQDLLLDDYIELARNGLLSPTDRANLQRWLMANGLDLDKTRVPKELQDKLTKKVKFDDDLEERSLKIV